MWLIEEKEEKHQFAFPLLIFSATSFIAKLLSFLLCVGCYVNNFKCRSWKCLNTRFYYKNFLKLIQISTPKKREEKMKIYLLMKY